MAQKVNTLLAMQESQAPTLDQDNTLEKEMATHSSISCLGNSMDRVAWWAIVHRVAESGTAEGITSKHYSLKTKVLSQHSS